MEGTIRSIAILSVKSRKVSGKYQVAEFSSSLLPAGAGSPFSVFFLFLEAVSHEFSYGWVIC